MSLSGFSTSSAIENEELRKGVERRYVLERKATSAVVDLADKSKQPVTVERLQKALILLDKFRYSDVLTERSLVGLCGYPLCDSQISMKTLFSRQKFKISLRDQRVYDIEQRKQFCSDACYRRSCHLLAQVSEEPVYLRNLESAEFCRTLASVDLLDLNSAAPTTDAADARCADKAINAGRVVLDGKSVMARPEEDQRNQRVGDEPEKDNVKQQLTKKKNDQSDEACSGDELADEDHESTSSDDRDDYDEDSYVDRQLSHSFRSVKLIDVSEIAHQ